MPQKFYIESDEEIISVIGRLRHSQNETNYFVFPKRSLVLQSIINLKLFQREAQKLGKKVIIVTQDEVGMMLAEKVGLTTERYTDDFSRKTSHLELVTPVERIATKTVPPEANIPASIPKLEELGSNDFYSAPPITSSPVHKKEERVLRVRNASPTPQTSLNSKRVEQTPPLRVAPRPYQTPSFESVPRIERGEQIRPLSKSNPLPIGSLPSNTRDDRLKNFFGGEKPVAPYISVKEQSTVPKVAVTSSKVGGIFLFLGSVSLLSLLGVLVYLFLPRAEIHVVPYKMTQNVDLQFEGRLEGVLSGEDTLPIRVLEKEQEVVFTVETTGASLGTAQKARGTVVIYNKFSTDPQSLVATTRLQSSDGKVFRLVAGVTVPGMTGGQAGAIEASVIADQPGVAYNITSSTFTVPGFQGSPKFEKFSAQSNKAMTGGSDASGSGLRVISKEDIDKAENEAREKAKQAYLEAIAKDLSAGEKVLEENIEITTLPQTTLPLSGTVADSFEYRHSFTVRGFIFSESGIKEKIMAKGETDINGVIFRPVTMTLSYGEALPDYEAKKLRLKVHALVDSESVIREDTLTEELLGKNSDGINEVLASFPEIKKIQITFKPPWFTSVVPSTKSRVTIIVEPGSSE